MSRLVLSALAAILAGIPVCEARQSTTTMSCAQAAATVAKAGAIVLTTGEFTYERFVAATTFCLGGETAERGMAPTADSPSCSVGYICRPRQDINDN
jgi:hypothetical protein